MKLLHIDSSIAGVGSVTRELSAEIVALLKGADKSWNVIYRDLVAEPLSHLTGGYLAALQGAPADQAVQADVGAGLAVMEDFLAADVIVIGAPKYNFGVPSQL